MGEEETLVDFVFDAEAIQYVSSRPTPVGDYMPVDNDLVLAFCSI